MLDKVVREVGSVRIPCGAILYCGIRHNEALRVHQRYLQYGVSNMVLQVQVLVEASVIRRSYLRAMTREHVDRGLNNISIV